MGGGALLQMSQGNGYWYLPRHVQKVGRGAGPGFAEDQFRHKKQFYFWDSGQQKSFQKFLRIHTSIVMGALQYLYLKIGNNLGNCSLGVAKSTVYLYDGIQYCFTQSEMGTCALM